MSSSLGDRSGRRAGLLSGASFVAVMFVLVPQSALAQELSNEQVMAGDAVQEESSSTIVVTATRVVRDGYEAPTPVSVLSGEEIASKAPSNLADFVNELPVLAGSTAPRANVASLSAGMIGINALNLRNIGANRTLVLLDGKRMPASTLTGLVDINTIPQGLVKRVDIVTGGVSAGWGSDAVAGVVNFVLDKDYTGLKGLAQGGVTTYGDGRNFNLSLTSGSKFANDRGHLLLSGELAHNEGIKGIGDRDWYNGAKLFFNPNYTATNGQPQLLALPNVGFATVTPGGIITSGPLKGTYFGPGGTPAQFNYGNIISGRFMVGGDWEYSDFGTTGDLDPELSRQSIFGHLSYDVTDNVQLYAQSSYSRAASEVASLNQFNFGNITIQPDNAFIPASIAGQVTAPFQLGTYNEDLGPILSNTERSAFRALVGLSGTLDAFGSEWSWDIYGQKSINRVYTGALISIRSNYANAIDAVRNESGAIVCRSTLTNPDNGCVPYNIFGTGVASEAARDYVLGTSYGKTKLTQDVLAATINGEPFATWAGPVSLALGIEHRREKASGTNDPLRAAASSSVYFAGNFTPSFGSYNVKEGFAELVVPLSDGAPFAEKLDLNAAIRATDYSTSGLATTWKLGLTYAPIEDITFRVVRSRDIRAPNLAELFQSGQTSTTSFPDPFNGNASVTAFQVKSGNLDLEPEKADSWGLGVVLQPRALPGFAASVDYYDIKIKDAISTTNAATIVSQCFQGNDVFCPLISRNASNVITSVSVVPVNVQQEQARGIDFEASYRRPAFGGDLSFRFLATRFLENYSNNGITPATDTVGTNGTNGTLRNSLPKWRYSASLAFDYDPIAVSLTARGFSDGVYNTSYIECDSECPTSTSANMTINDNDIPGAIYFDANVRASLSDDIEAFVSVDNILNRDPYQMAFGPSIGAAPLSVNPLLYDVLGRNFRFGIRFEF